MGCVHLLSCCLWHEANSPSCFSCTMPRPSCLHPCRSPMPSRRRSCLRPRRRWPRSRRGWRRCSRSWLAGALTWLHRCVARGGAPCLPPSQLRKQAESLLAADWPVHAVYEGKVVLAMMAENIVCDAWFHYMCRKRRWQSVRRSWARSQPP